MSKMKAAGKTGNKTGRQVAGKVKPPRTKKAPPSPRPARIPRPSPLRPTPPVTVPVPVTVPAATVPAATVPVAVVQTPIRTRVRVPATSGPPPVAEGAERPGLPTTAPPVQTPNAVQDPPAVTPNPNSGT